MGRDYRTKPKNFTSRLDESVYSPDEKLIKTLHQLLDVLQPNLAMAIDDVVAQLMRCEGYGQPIRYREVREPELLESENIEEDLDG